jgi:hypothetical protein
LNFSSKSEWLKFPELVKMRGVSPSLECSTNLVRFERGKSLRKVDLTMKEVNATLSAHSGAQLVTREALRTVPTPNRTSSHVPIPHIQVVELVESYLSRYGFKIKSEEFAVQTDGLKLFGTMVLSHQTRDDFSFAIGLRTSNDKTIPVQLVVGVSIFVCDNMAFSGDAIMLTRKHTSRIDIKWELQGAVNRAVQRFDGFDNRIQELKTLAISDAGAKSKMLDAAIQNIIPLRLLPAVHKEYFEPRHKDFEPRTAWSLHNAFTESFKLLKPNVAMEANMGLGKMFRL